MKPLVVTAHLSQGYSAADPWSPSFDAILAYWALRERLGEEQFALGMTGHRELVTVEELPLGREEWDGRWWWQCSSPIADGDAQVFARHYHRRFDDEQAYRYAPEGTKRVETAAGPFKTYRHRRYVRLVPRLTWHVIGDADGIRRLLRRCDYVGHGIARGWGAVTEWEVREGGDPGIARFRRPVPVSFAEAHGLRGAPYEWGLVPPGRDPRNRTLCVMPV